MARWNHACPNCGHLNPKPPTVVVGSGDPAQRCRACKVPLFPGLGPTPDPAPGDLFATASKVNGFSPAEVAHASGRVDSCVSVLAQAAAAARMGNVQAAGQIYGLEFVRKLGTVACARILDIHELGRKATASPNVDRVLQAFDQAREAGADW